MLLIAFFLGSCKHKRAGISFYYWKTHLALDSAEKEAIQYNEVKKIYLRYFDIDMEPGGSFPLPVSPLVWNGNGLALPVIPVIFIRNRTFGNFDSAMLQNLAVRVYGLVKQMNESFANPGRQIQFDCDWTDKTRDNYFRFLQMYTTISQDTVSCTIRLHQVKYRKITGVPPVSKGVLMMYNMGNITAGSERSVYEPGLAKKYLPSLAGYPLPLDLALPIFSWGLQIRENRVVQLLNKMRDDNIENDTNFIAIKPHWFEAKRSCFRGGYYFRQDDRIKIEQLSENEVEEMGSLVKQYSTRPFETVIFYDLDQSNLEQYDKDIFKKTVDRLGY